MDARTGDRVLLRDIVKDGQTGLPVTRESYDGKHPQENAPPVFDPQVLRRPAPNLDRPGYTVAWPTSSLEDLGAAFNPPLWIAFEVARPDFSLAGHVFVDDVFEVDVFE